MLSTIRGKRTGVALGRHWSIVWTQTVHEAGKGVVYGGNLGYG